MEASRLGTSALPFNSSFGPDIGSLQALLQGQSNEADDGVDWMWLLKWFGSAASYPASFEFHAFPTPGEKKKEM